MWEDIEEEGTLPRGVIMTVRIGHPVRGGENTMGTDKDCVDGQLR